MAELKDVVAQVKDVYNICDIVEQENVTLRASGPGEYTGLCPFHTEKTPSFKVNERFQNYKCFGCGASGDIITFITETKGCSFMEALKYLADSKGIELPSTFTNNDNRPKIDMNKLYALVKDARDYYREEFLKLDTNHPAKKEILSRGLSIDNEVYGYAPETYGALYKHLSSLGYTNELMLQSQLVMEKDGKFFDFFFGRLLFTLSDFSGRPVSFSSRKLFETDNRGKYVNGKGSPVFAKKSTLYNLQNAKSSARQLKQIVLSEGQFDVEALREAGVENVVASSGTAFTEEHLKSARQIVGEDGKLIFAFDGDSAGIEAALKVFIHFPITHSVSEVVLFPEGKDPCDIFKESNNEGEELRELMSTSVPIMDFVLTECGKRGDFSNMNGRYKFIKNMIVKFISFMNEDVLIDYMIKRISIISGVELSKVQDMYKEVKKNGTKKLRPQKEETEVLLPDIEINEFNDSDVCYVRLCQLIIHNPLLLMKYAKKTKIPKKFHIFLREIIQNIKKYQSRNELFKFIPEQYTNSEFGKYLLNKDFDSRTPTENEELIHYFVFLQDSGFKFYQEQIIEQERARVMEAITSAKDNDELISLLALLDETEKRIRNNNQLVE